MSITSTVSRWGWLVLAVGFALAQPPQISSDRLSRLHYRYIGPLGNRVIAAAGIPGDRSVRLA